jgi:hypothetical protein
VLFAADWPFDHFITHGAIFYAVTAGNGQNLGGRKDVVRRWMHWRDPPYLRCLYDPSVGHRVESELDDHGETYPASLDGPDVCIWAKVPEGQSAVSLYFVNKDGHTGQNAERDYVVRVQKVQRLYDNGSSPTLASARVINFWGGVYEQFAVRGPAVFRFEIKRNHSLNAICSGIFIDRISGPSTFLDGMPMPSMGDVRYDPPSDPAFGAPAAAPRLAAAGRLWGEADSVRTESPSRAREEKILAFRMASAAGPDQLAGWRWQLRLWNNDDRRGFDVATAAAWPAFIQEMGINQASVR